MPRRPHELAGAGGGSVIPIVLTIIAALVALGIQHARWRPAARKTERVVGDAVAAVLGVPRNEVQLRVELLWYAPHVHVVRVARAPDGKAREAEKVVETIIAAARARAARRA